MKCEDVMQIRHYYNSLFFKNEINLFLSGKCMILVNCCEILENTGLLGKMHIIHSLQIFICSYVQNVHNLLYFSDIHRHLAKASYNGG